jgi:hypothetical protein
MSIGEIMFHYNKNNALKWCYKYGQTNKDHRTALHVLEFVVIDAITVSESIDDIDACTKALLSSLEILTA